MDPYIFYKKKLREKKSFEWLRLNFGKWEIEIDEWLIECASDKWKGRGGWVPTSEYKWDTKLNKTLILNIYKQIKNT